MLRSYVLVTLILGVGLGLSAEAHAGSQLRQYFELRQGQNTVHSDRDSSLQELVDNTYRELLETDFGKDIVRTVLDCSPELLMKHLGVSQKSSVQISNKICTTPRKTGTHKWIFTLPDENGPEKVVSLRQKNRRTYSLILATDNDNGLDSWTDFRTQTTTIFFNENADVSFLRYKLLFILAHETAIYFDQKSQLNSYLWSQHPEFRNYSAVNNLSQSRRLDEFLVAANNPLISQVLSFIRAFQVEALWLRQIPEESWGSLFANSQRDLKQLDFKFARATCNEDCLIEYIQVVSEQLLPYTLPLLANSRYWSMKLSQMGSEPPTPDNSDIRRVLIDFKNYYVSMAPSANGTLTSPDDPAYLSVADETARVFRDILIPKDLQIIKTTSIQRPPVSTQSSLNFLTTPSIGNFGVELASGPRPRIRTGSSFHIDLNDMSVFGRSQSLADSLFSTETFLNFLQYMAQRPGVFDSDPPTPKPRISTSPGKSRPYDVNILPEED